MAKLSIEDKKEIIRLHNEEGKGAAELGRLYKINVSGIQLLLRKYREKGETIFVKKYRVFSASEKLSIINEYLSGDSKNAIVCKHNIQVSMLISWLKRYKENGYNGLVDKKKGRKDAMKNNDKSVEKDADIISPSLNETDKDAQIKMLKRRNLELEAEVEVLKN